MSYLSKINLKETYPDKYTKYVLEIA